MNKFKKILYPAIVIIFFAFTFQSNPPSGWYQQTLPNVNGMPISDMTFLDSLTGFIVTGDNTVGDTNFILKTTNGGDNWNIILRIYRDLKRVIFANDSVGYVCGGLNSVGGIVLKTTNTGNNWFEISTPVTLRWNDMSVLSQDTIYLVDNNGFDGGLFRTTDGGINWTRLINPSGSLPDKIHMVNGSLGFMADGGNYLRRTTDGGFNWTTIPSVGGFSDMVFFDTLIGWKCFATEQSYEVGRIKKTTDGGLNWFIQTLPPQNSSMLYSRMSKISMINKDTLWGVGGTIDIGVFNYRGIIYKTTNGGTTWGYQLPDTIINVFKYNSIDFVNSKTGWTYFLNSGVHTKIGGNDTTIYTSIKQIPNEVPDNYVLHQNYPNPFNPTTNIGFRIANFGFIKLNIYDITGKLIQTLINQTLNRGEYKTEFNANNITSGTYFYS